MVASSKLDLSGDLDIRAFLVCEIRNARGPLHRDASGQFFGCLLVLRLEHQKFRRIGTYFGKQCATREELDTNRLSGCPCWEDFKESKEEIITLI